MTIYALNDLVPDIHPDAWVAPDATIIGNVTLGAGVSVWFGSILRGDNEPIVLGEGSNVQEDVVMHTDPGFPLRIGPGCTVGHKAMLHGCLLGENTLIGMGATVLNGARLAPNCLIGACALITEGKDIPERSLVMGAPGKVVRQLDEDAIAGLRRSAEHYQARAKVFRDGLRPVPST